MEKLFLEVLNMSITAGYCVLAVVLIRLLIKRFPKIYSYVLWSVVFFRLVCPVSVESVFSFLQFVPETLSNQEIDEIVNNDNIVSGAVKNIQDTASPGVGSTSDVINNALNNTAGNVSGNVAGNIVSDTANQSVSDVVSSAGSVAAETSLLLDIITVAAIVWLVAALGLIVYSIVSAIHLKKKLKNAVHTEENVYEVKELSTPFVFGVIKPRIYLPASLKEPERSFVLKHELTHLRRKDYIIKQAAFWVVCVHWFNPLAWLAFYLMSKDMEMSCDESVISKLSKEEKADYSETLLLLATDRRVVGLGPLAFGEGNVRNRIKNILNYKKPMMWLTLIITALLSVVLIGLAVNPKDKGFFSESPETESVSEEDTLVDEKGTLKTGDESRIEAANDPVEVIEAYVEYMGHDWNSLANLFPSADIKENLRFLNNQDNIEASAGILNVNDAKLLEVVEVDIEYVKGYLNENYEDEIVRTFAVCIDYSTNTNNWQYASGIEYDAVSLILEDNLWKISECERINNNITRLVNVGYELSEEYVDAAVEKHQWMVNGFGAKELDKKYRGDAVMYYDMEERIVDGHRIKNISDESYDINNLIKVSYYEQSDVSLYCYEVKTQGDYGYVHISYNLLLEHDGVYQVFDDDSNIGFDVMFGYNSGLDYVHDRAFDKGYEIDCDSDGELELAEVIMQTNGSDGYDVDALVVFDYNAETGLYELYSVGKADFYDMTEAAAEKFIDEYYGDYTIDEYGAYVFEDGYIITVWNNMYMYENDDGSYSTGTFVWGNPWAVVEGEMLSLGNEIGTVTLNIRYIGNGQFAVKAERYTQWS